MSNHSFSLAICGDGAVGKSSIIKAFKDEGFSSIYRQTLGIAFLEKQIKIRGNAISLRLWDIGGQSLNSNNIYNYLIGANAIFICYDVTNKESFMNTNDWLLKVNNALKKNISNDSINSNGHGNVSLYLVGNKIDLFSSRQVTVEMHNDFIHNNNLKDGLFLSAKSGENLMKSFYKIAGDVVGLPLSSAELATYDKVLSAVVSISDDNEGRTALADQIEAEDREAMRKQQQQDAMCCIIC